MFYRKSDGVEKKRKIRKEQRIVMENRAYELSKPKEKYKEPSEDSKKRMNIQLFIEDAVKDGYKNYDIIEVLKRKCPEYEEYFEEWIKNWRIKATKNMEK